MDCIIAREIRMGFGTISVLAKNQGHDWERQVSPILSELDKVIEQETEIVVGTSLRTSMVEIKKFIEYGNIENVVRLCDNITQTLHSV